MIKINIQIKKKWSKLSVTGHAGYNPGNDIVCAGVSAIVNALAGYIENSKYEEKKIKAESGVANISVKGNAVEVFTLALIGFLQIEKTYPNNVKVLYEKKI